MLWISPFRVIASLRPAAVLHFAGRWSKAKRTLAIASQSSLWRDGTERQTAIRPDTHSAVGSGSDVAGRSSSGAEKLLRSAMADGQIPINWSRLPILRRASQN